MIVPKTFLRIAFFMLFTLASCQTPTEAPEGPEVAISVMKTTVNIVSNLVQTTVEIHLKNLTLWIVGSQLQFPLPQGVSVSRFALELNGTFRDAVPVGKNQGTQVFEALESVKDEPSSILTKCEQGNSFKTRVYPIYPGKEYKILIGYQEQLDLNDKNEFLYRVVSFISGAEASSVDINILSDHEPQILDDLTNKSQEIIKTDSGFRYSVQTNNRTPSKPISIHIPQPNMKPMPLTTYLHETHYFYGYVNLTPLLQSSSVESQSSNIALIWDTSFSCKGRNTGKEFKLLDDYFSSRKVSVDVYFVGYYFWQAQSFSVDAGDWSKLRTFLKEVLYDGGTKFSDIRLTKKFDEVLFFTDGVSNLGKASDIQFQEGQTVHCINSLPAASHDFLNYLAIRQFGSYVDLNSLSPIDAVRLLRGSVNRFQGIEDNSNVYEVYPRAGSPVLTNLFSLVGRASSLPQTITLKFGPSAGNITERLNLTIAENFNKHVLVDKLWAEKAIASLEYNYEDNKDEINALGVRFGIATKGIGLLVLGNLNDYIRFGINPPEALRQQFDKIQKQSQSVLLEEKQKARMLSEYWEKLSVWWKAPTGVRVRRPDPNPLLYGDRFGKSWFGERSPRTTFDVGGGKNSDSIIQPLGIAKEWNPNPNINPTPNQLLSLSTLLDGKPLSPRITNKAANGIGGASISTLNVNPATSSNHVSPLLMQLVPSVPVLSISPSLPQSWKIKGPSIGTDIRPSQNTRENIDTDSSVSISFSAGLSKEYSTTRAYMPIISSAIGQESQYAAYLTQRDLWATNALFFIDSAKFFLSTNRTLALQILSNVADITLEDAFLYKTLASYFKQFRAYTDCLYVTKKINDWRTFQPQSHRDLALAYQLNGDIKNAVDQLSQVINTTYYNGVADKADGIQDTILMDVSRMVSEYGADNFVGKLADEFLKPLPVDLRVVISWDKPRADLDLYVEKTGIAPNLIDVEGIYSKDFGGLGPEQLLLKNLSRGEYRISCDYYHYPYSKYHYYVKLTNSGPVTVNLEIYLRLQSGKMRKEFKTIQIVGSWRNYDEELARINI